MERMGHYLQDLKGELDEPPALSSLNIRVLFSFLYTWGTRSKLQGPLSTHRVFKKNFFNIFNHHN